MPRTGRPQAALWRRHLGPAAGALAAIALLALCTGPASAVNLQTGAGAAPTGELIERVTPHDMVAALRTAGALGIRHTEDAEGDPMIEAAKDGISFVVKFYDCEDEACSQVQFLVSFDLPGLPAETKARIARDWNHRWVTGRAYVSRRGFLLLEHPIYAAGGVSADNLWRNTRLWLNMLPEFATAVGWE